ncbi:MAG: dependent oxidoreductase [Actinomycetia bacterium]|nr:dependent oxidoreductase [Actinomycetes bacterium]
MPSHEYDAVVVGSGPNGLTAAAVIARAGHSVLVVEAADTPGGGTRTKELTLPGFHHDVCSAIHPTGVTSPAFASLELERHGLEWIHPDLSLAHPFDDGTAAELHRTIDATVAANDEGHGWRTLLGPLVDGWPALADALLGPPVRGLRHPVAFTRFGLRALPPASTTARRLLPPRAGALFLGSAAHANTSLHRPLSSAAGLLLATAGHAGGWPLARGGSQAIADALVAVIEAAGGRVETGRRITSIDELPRARAVLFDTTPWQLLDMAGHRLPASRQWRYRRFRRGAGSFKLDYALDGPVPWTAEAARRAGTVHLGGTLDEVVDAEQDVWKGRIPDRPFVLVAQQSLFDPSRAPEGKHTLWVYGHVPNGSTVDMTDRIEGQLDRFAPGWRDLVLARHATPPMALEAYNANYVGGDIAAGAPDGVQLVFRPVIALDPYRTGAEGIYLCSASTPPGGGVHGMCGWSAAQSALEQLGR